MLADADGAAAAGDERAAEGVASRAQVRAVPMDLSVRVEEESDVTVALRCVYVPYYPESFLVHKHR